MSNRKTQCPHCKTVYPMPAAQLSKSKAQAKCGKCHRVFLLNLHLLEDEPKSTAPAAPKPTVPKPAQNPQNDLTLAPIPTRKKNKKVEPKAGMIFDDMEIDGEDNSAVQFDDDELNAFLKQNTQTGPLAAATKTQVGADDSDESWADALLKDAAPEPKAAPVSERKADDVDLSAMIGADLEGLIPEVRAQKDPEAIRQKVNERLSGHAPTQEQIAKRRSLGSRLLWLLGCAVMLGMLLVQYVVFNWNNIAKDPERSALLTRFCPVCVLPAANADAFGIDYTLKSGSADYSADLSAVIHNRSDSDQLYPNLRIRVFGHSGLVGDLALGPKDYLAFGNKTLQAGQQERFLLTLDVAVDDIKSIQIEPFY